MATGYSTPCQGELDFWRRVPSVIHELAMQVKRVADALEAQNETGPLMEFNGVKLPKESKDGK